MIKKLNIKKVMVKYVNNVLNETQILPLRVSATGAIVNYRFQVPREFTLTSKLTF